MSLSAAKVAEFERLAQARPMSREVVETMLDFLKFAESHFNEPPGHVLYNAGEILDLVKNHLVHRISTG